MLECKCAGVVSFVRTARSTLLNLSQCNAEAQQATQPVGVIVLLSSWSEGMY